MEPIYFLTKQDNDYNIKGSRDPLGFQVIWQNTGRKLIPFLSTVSGSIRDFQILCLAYYSYGKEPDAYFVHYFLRFEQLFAYARYFLFDAEQVGFNGIDKVRKIIFSNVSSVTISNKKENELLSNQRAYGIWGKYNRPFQDISFNTKENFQEIFSTKIKGLEEANAIEVILLSLKENKEIIISLDKIKILLPLFQITPHEKIFYTENLLKVKNKQSYQNTLFDYIMARKSVDSSLYDFLTDFKIGLLGKEPQLFSILEDIENTERVLSPLNQIFRYLQKKPQWLKETIESDDFITQCKREIDYVFDGITEMHEEKNILANYLTESNWGLVSKLVSRNEKITTARGGTAWLSLKDDRLIDIHHAEGGNINPNFNPITDTYNSYFINTYLNLFSQLN